MKAASLAPGGAGGPSLFCVYAPAGHQGILFLGKYRTQVTHEHLHAEEEESSYTRLFLSSGWDTYFSSLTNVADIYRTRTKKTETSGAV